MTKETKEAFKQYTQEISESLSYVLPDTFGGRDRVRLIKKAQNKLEQALAKEPDGDTRDDVDDM